MASHLWSNRIWAKALRSPLRLVPDKLVVPVLSGPLMGAQWIVGSQRHACWLGIYERHVQRVLARTVSPTTVFYDIGANVGFYSLIAARIANAGRVYSFEPLLRNLEYLKRHLELNQIRNGTVFDLAVSDQCGESTFSYEATGAMGSLAPHGELRVRTASIDALLADQQMAAPDCIKMDIEGAEAVALAGARECFTRYKPKLFLATHGRVVHEQCCRLLVSWGYTIQILDDSEEDRADLFAYAA